MNHSCCTETHPHNRLKLVSRVQTISFPVAQSRFYIRVNCVLRYGREQVPPDNFILVRACCSKAPYHTYLPTIQRNKAAARCYLQPSRLKKWGREELLSTDWDTGRVLFKKSASHRLLVWCFFYCRQHLLLLQGCNQDYSGKVCFEVRNTTKRDSTESDWIILPGIVNIMFLMEGIK